MINGTKRQCRPACHESQAPAFTRLRKKGSKYPEPIQLGPSLPFLQTHQIIFHQFHQFNPINPIKASPFFSIFIINLQKLIILQLIIFCLTFSAAASWLYLSPHILLLPHFHRHIPNQKKQHQHHPTPPSTKKDQQYHHPPPIATFCTQLETSPPSFS